MVGYLWFISLLSKLFCHLLFLASPKLCQKPDIYSIFLVWYEIPIISTTERGEKLNWDALSALGEIIGAFDPQVTFSGNGQQLVETGDTAA